jgi:hypothetical protein
VRVAPSDAASKTRFLVLHDYGMGGVWWWVHARSEEVGPDGRRLRQVELTEDGMSHQSTPEDWPFNPPLVDRCDPAWVPLVIGQEEFEAQWTRAVHNPSRWDWGLLDNCHRDWPAWHEPSVHPSGTEEHGTDRAPHTLS